MQLTWGRPVDLRVDHALGYVYFMDREHPLANSQGKVYYHRHVASLSQGRWVTPDEVVHHLDEDRQNNAPGNLKVMSRPEHARTHYPAQPPRVCPVCKKVFATEQNEAYCSPQCSAQSMKRFDPSKEELAKMVRAMPATKVAAYFGVSPSAVQKRCKSLGIQKPGRGYWSNKHTGL